MWEWFRRSRSCQLALVLSILLSIGAGSVGACYINDEHRNAKGGVRGRCNNNDKPIACKKVYAHKGQVDDLWVCKGPSGTKKSWSLTVAVDQACGCRK
jgi:hypothetical protein